MSGAGAASRKGPAHRLLEHQFGTGLALLPPANAISRTRACAVRWPRHRGSSASLASLQILTGGRARMPVSKWKQRGTHPCMPC